MPDSQLNSVLVKIHGYAHAFTKKEQIVANYVLENPDDIVYLSVIELAELAKVGETTVIRFCRELGYKGYQEFKLALAKESSSSNSNVDESNLIGKIGSSHIKAIEGTLSLIDPASLEDAFDMIVQSKRIHFCGVGTSGITAMDAKSKFLRIGIRSEVTTDTHFQLMNSSVMNEDDVVIGFSISGSTVDTIRVLELAKENGAKTIVVTQFAKSPITRTGDIILLTAGREAPLEGGSLAAKIAQLVVVDLLCTGVTLRRKDESLHYQRKTAESVVDKIY
ncbi:MurR/RpiR family transcriptional regulator [Alicyclobacillus sp. SO9]|uniref:MurR/RpiR family transcriptional regulator n=1 Tax=Alicyclobacillus sp. SO9 TaxID=2665646 RepID=UPI0018E718CC|nr:MurR/RpiR family transcriptional regulator [Alicyclobacillus sp. SO9]QQE78416.1 MurR/RpiR family transcriptional regulator [Alicyclobacillus sp. SO9]